MFVTTSTPGAATGSCSSASLPSTTPNHTLRAWGAQSLIHRAVAVLAGFGGRRRLAAPSPHSGASAGGAGCARRATASPTRRCMRATSTTTTRPPMNLHCGTHLWPVEKHSTHQTCLTKMHRSRRLQRELATRHGLRTCSAHDCVARRCSCFPQRLLGPPPGIMRMQPRMDCSNNRRRRSRRKLFRCSHPPRNRAPVPRH